MNKVTHQTDDKTLLESMGFRLARFDALMPGHDCIDAQIPGFERTTLHVIGDPVDAPIAADDFHLDLVHCEPGRCVPLHRRETAATFMVLTGAWEIVLELSDETNHRLAQWDTLVVPPGVSCGFRNVSDAPACLLGIVSGRKSGSIDWPAAIREAARVAGVNLPVPALRKTHGYAPAQAPVIETPRLRLRPFEQGDLDAYARICADQETMLYLGQGAALTRLEAWRQMAAFEGAWRLIGCGQWAVTRRDNGALLGRVGYLDMPGWPDLELGWLVTRAEWGQGYAFEAASTVLDHAWRILRRKHLISMIRPANERSIRLAIRLGARLDGRIELFGTQALVYRHDVPDCGLTLAHVSVSLTDGTSDSRE